MNNQLSTNVNNKVSQYSFDELDKMSKLVASSNFLGTKNPAEVFTLFMIAQAEGKNPVQASMEYSIIQGRPALKSQAVLVRFQNAGGKIKYLKRDDNECRILFSHPQAGELAVSWTMETAKQVGLAGKDNWRKYPRQMLAARCIAEGIRALYPACLDGLYLVDEVQDFDKGFNHNVIDTQADDSTYNADKDVYEHKIENADYIKEYINDVKGNACAGDEITFEYKDRQIFGKILEDEYIKENDNVIHYFTIEDLKGNKKKILAREVYQKYTLAKAFNEDERLYRLNAKYTKKKIAEGVLDNPKNETQIDKSLKLEICPTGISKGCKWTEMPTEKLEKYYRDYKSGKLIGYAEEYSAYIEQILLERRNNQTNSQTQVVTVSEDEDPFSSANDDDWDNMIEEQEKRNKTPHQIDDDEEDGFILEN